MDIEQYKKLLCFFGYGNFPEAHFIIWGNEEGTGGYPIVPNINARCNNFGKNDKGEYIYLLRDKWQQGYYENSEHSGTNKLARYIDTDDNNYYSPGLKHSNFLELVARFCLALEDKEDFEKWFSSYDERPDLKESIKDCYRNQIFKDRDGIKTALIDWRPLPRMNEKTWYPEEYANIDKTKYLKAFKLNKANKAIVLKDEFTNYLEDVNMRKEIIRDVFTEYSFPLGIAFGDIETKKELIKEIFKDDDVYISTENLVNFPYIKWYKLKINTNKKAKVFLLLPFPDHRLKIYKDDINRNRNKTNMLLFFKEIFINHIQSTINDQ